ncbi:MAG: YbaN family protein [Alphaproteobacteria bacterium]|nr:YbaN family protein [Alphaproteobacteria bacterium]
MLLWGGHLLFALGAIGLALPLFPTTVFWIGAAWCYARSAPHLRARIFAWPAVGRPIRDYLVDGTAERGTKLLAVAGMALGATGAILVPTGGGTLALAAKGTTLALMALAAIHVLRLPARCAGRHRSGD